MLRTFLWLSHNLNAMFNVIMYMNNISCEHNLRCAVVSTVCEHNDLLNYWSHNTNVRCCTQHLEYIIFTSYMHTVYMHTIEIRHVVKY